MSYVEKRSKLEQKIDKMSEQLAALMSEIETLKNKEAEAERISDDITSAQETLDMLNEVYEEGRANAEISEDEKAEVAKELAKSIFQQFIVADMQCGTQITNDRLADMLREFGLREELKVPPSRAEREAKEDAA